jgi:fructokinase
MSLQKRASTPPLILGVGEILWDLLPSGPQLGGAPANFAYHAHALGARAAVVSRVGCERYGREVFERLRTLGLPEDTIQVDDHAPTGTVTVTLTDQGVPHYTIHENVAWDRLAVTASALEAVCGAQAVCFGSLAQRAPASRATIQRLVAAAPATAWRVFDINLRQHYYSREVLETSLGLVNALKVNEAELERLAEIFALRGDPRSQISQLAERHGLRVVACTRGERGSLLQAGGRWSDHPGVTARVADTVGAGDSFTAAMILGLLARWDLDEINQRANEVAAHVASCAGATPELPEALRAPFRAGLAKALDPA